MLIEEAERIFTLKSRPILFFTKNTMSCSSTKPPSVVDRYFKKRFKIDNHGKASEDQTILIHSNRVCVVCLAKSHPILLNKKCVKEVDFAIKGANRLNTKLSGKFKRGAQWLNGNDLLCKVMCTDGSEYTLTCGVKGQLLEVNENLLKNPELLTKKPLGIGYLAVMLPGLKWFDKEIARLKTEEEYEALRSQNATEPV